jgi:starch synthase (maltosyl-transferring)
LTEYLTELTQSEVREYFRPNLWPNTPDILPEHLQSGGRPAFIARLVLAGTLGASYGIYGPAFETLEHEPREPGSEEYLHSEKYQLREWDFSRPENLTATITALNRARRENRALQSNESLRFHAVDNEQIICYSKRCQDNVILVIVNLGYHELQRGFVELTLAELGLGAEQPYRVEDLLNDRHVFEWQGARNFVELDPHKCVAHILRVVPQG